MKSTPERLGQRLGLVDDRAATGRRQEGERGITAAGGRRVNIEEVIGVPHQAIAQGIGKPRRHVAVRIAREGDPRVRRALIHGRFQELSDEVPVLGLEGERVLNRHHQNRPFQRLDVQIVGETRKNFDPIDLVAVDRGAQIEHRPGFGAAHNDQGHLDPTAVGQFEGSDSRPFTAAARQPEPFDFQYGVGFERRIRHGRLPRPKFNP